uniref:Uncharacterized protein n=1 Tax=Romanomermis culicivorax TaxID=13658 RepID=A0A915IB34_ROMCU
MKKSDKESSEEERKNDNSLLRTSLTGSQLINNSKDISLEKDPNLYRKLYKFDFFFVAKNEYKKQKQRKTPKTSKKRVISKNPKQ